MCFGVAEPRLIRTRRVLKNESYGVRWSVNPLVRELRVAAEPLCTGFLSTLLDSVQEGRKYLQENIHIIVVDIQMGNDPAGAPAASRHQDSGLRGQLE